MKPGVYKTVDGHAVRVIEVTVRGYLIGDDGRSYERTPNWHSRIQLVQMGWRS